jgi:hypothetical protein
MERGSGAGVFHSHIHLRLLKEESLKTVNEVTLLEEVDIFQIRFEGT